MEMQRGGVLLLLLLLLQLMVLFIFHNDFPTNFRLLWRSAIFLNKFYLWFLHAVADRVFAINPIYPKLGVPKFSFLCLLSCAPCLVL
jgi:hypothetical protein